MKFEKKAAIGSLFYVYSITINIYTIITIQACQVVLSAKPGLLPANS